MSPRRPGQQAASAVAFPDEAAARAALEAEEITAYYVVPADYLTSPQVQLFYWQKAPGDDVTSGLNRMLRAALAARAPADVRDRLMTGPNFTYQSLEGDERGIEKQVLGFLLPLLIGMFFVFVVMGSAGYLLQAVTTEKENRMVEVMFTSVSPLQLIGGKAVGLMGVAFTQIGIWVPALVAAVLVAARFVPFFRSDRDRSGLPAARRALFYAHLCPGSRDDDHAGQHRDGSPARAADVRHRQHAVHGAVLLLRPGVYEPE